VKRASVLIGGDGLGRSACGESPCASVDHARSGRAGLDVPDLLLVLRRGISIGRPTHGQLPPVGVIPDPSAVLLWHHGAWRPGQAEIATAGGVGRRSAKNATRRMDQAREAHHPARPHHSSEGAMRKAARCEVGQFREAPAGSMLRGVGGSWEDARWNVRVGTR
jgi:hypothetical protein